MTQTPKPTQREKNWYDLLLETINTIAIVGVAGATIYVVMTLLPEILNK